ncbi:MAG: hypothetical protein SNH01_05525 [Rikenellaceae bacterium]
MSKSNLPSYSVAIRTLGKAGAIYQNLLDSIVAQTHKPEKIVIYLAEGYDKPTESVGVEEIVVVPKGMIAQRSLQYKEIESEYILLLDDDVSLAPDSAEKMCRAMVNDKDAAFCVADVFHTAHRSLKQRIVGFCKQLTYTRKDDGWGVKICRNGSCSFNNSPSTTVVKTESGAGPASMWRKQSFLDIHFEDERWMDKFSYALGDDQLMFYKVIVNGSYGLMCYDSGIVHEDAQTSQGSAKKDNNKTFYRSQLRYIVWYRTIYECSKSFGDRVLNRLSYMILIALIATQHLALSIVKLSPNLFVQFIKGQIVASRYVKSAEYKAIPQYKLNNN